jgi:hypothetical protein
VPSTREHSNNSSLMPILKQETCTSERPLVHCDTPDLRRRARQQRVDMQVTENDLRERYAGMETEQLLELQAQGSLTETAGRVLEEESSGGRTS